MLGALGLKVIQDDGVLARIALPLDEVELMDVGGLVVVLDKDGELLEELVDRFHKREGEGLSWLKQMRSELIDGERGGGVMMMIKQIGARRVAYISGWGEEIGVSLIRNENKSELWPVVGEVVSGWLEDGVRVEVEELVSSGVEAGEEEEDGQNKSVELKEGSELVVEPRRNWLRWWKKKDPDLRLRPEMSKRRKLLLIAGGVFLVLFVVNVGLGMWRKKSLDKRKEYELVAQPIKDALTEAVTVVGVNDVRARGLVAGAKDSVEAHSGLAEGDFGDEWKSLVSEVDRKWIEVSGEKQMAANLWLELAVVKEGMVGDRLTIDGEWLEVLDKGGKVVVAVNVKDKTSKMLMAGDGLNGVVDMGGGVVLVGGKVWRLDAEKKDNKVVYENEEELAGGKRIQGYSGNLYLLDGSEVWKFPVGETGIGSRRRYFGVGVVPILSEVVDMWVDGDVWLATDKGKVTRYSRGQKVEFGLKGWMGEWKETKRVMTTESEVLIWDKGEGVVGVFDKETGDYKRKIVAGELKEAADVVVDENKSRLILVVGGRLMELSYN